jgi:DNA-binding NtrC family response regulator
MTRINNETASYHVLILEPDSRQAAALLESLAQRGIHGTVAVNAGQADNLLGRFGWKLIFVSEDFLTVSGRGANSTLAQFRLNMPEIPLVLIGAEDSSRKALQAIREGFAEYIARPVDRSKAAAVLERFVPNHPTSVLESVCPLGGMNQWIVGDSVALRQVLTLAKKTAPTSAAVLIEGESGTGKELLAQLLHDNSRRSGGPFIKVNCAALNESLLESELFGHEKGAFTGALFCRKGRFEQAHGGTLLLDEITETPPAFQAKLLRAIEQMSFERVGGNDPVRINVRIVSTTNRSIGEWVGRGQFRADLYYRLSVIRLRIPPLRERKEDIRQLVWLFVNEFAGETARKISAVDRRTLELWERYDWPGNIRQLRNMVRSAMILGSGPVLSIEQIPWLMEELREGLVVREGLETETGLMAGTSLEELERRAILATLQRENGNQAQAARVLGISDRTLREKMKRYRQVEPRIPVVQVG